MKDMLKKVFKHWEMFLVIFLILVVVVLGREIAGQHMLSHLFKRRRKE